MSADLERWRARAREELGERSGRASIDGIPIQALYVERPRKLAPRGRRGFVVALAASQPATITRAKEHGAEALWIEAECTPLDAIELPAYTDVRDADPRRLPITSGALTSAITANSAAWSRDCAARGARGLLASSRREHDAGAGSIDEIAIMLARGVAQLRNGADARALCFEMALDADVFTGLAKLRAARWCWSKIARSAGLTEPMFVHACSSRRALSKLDPHMNLLRGTAAAIAAICGGADIVSIEPYEPGPRGERCACNTQFMLREESRLDLAIDPAGGSYYVEALTEALARGAWTIVQEIEARGGAIAAASWMDERVASAAQARHADVASRKIGLVGVNRYPSSAPPIDAEWIETRDAAPFEALRARVAALPADRRRASIWVHGDRQKLRPRIGFVTDVLAIAGFEAQVSETPAPLVAQVAADADYAALEWRIDASAVIGAGRPEVAPDVRNTGWIHIGADLLLVLERCVTAVEGKRP